MSSLFFDTSGLAKRYMPEQGTAWVRQQTASSANNTIFIAQITPVELYSAISRQYHDGHIDLPRLQAFRRLFERHLQAQYLTLTLSSGILTMALDLQESYRLRAYDAVQLASAQALQARLTSAGQSLTFISADKRLLQSALAVGLATDNPDNHT